MRIRDAKAAYLWNGKKSKKHEMKIDSETDLLKVCAPEVVLRVDE